MKLAERDFRLAQVRKEKTSVESELREMEDEAERQAMDEEADILRIKERHSRKMKALKNRSSGRKFWDGIFGDLFSDSGYSDEDDDDSDGLMGIGESLMDIFVTTKFKIPLMQDLEKRLKELNEEEARLLGVKIEDEPRVNEREIRKNEIFQRRAQRLIEKDKHISAEIGGKPRDQWTDEEMERVRRLENAYNQADVRDLDELSEIL